MADAMLEKVKQYAAEIEAQGKSAGYAYATAWARACKYHPELDAAGHCKRPRRQYLAVKAARRVLGSLHKRCRELRLGGDVLYWAAMAKGVQTAPYVYGQHTVLKYGREAFAPSLDTAAAIDQVVARGRTGSLGVHPPEAMATDIDRVLGIGPKRNPRPTVVRRAARRNPQGALAPKGASFTRLQVFALFERVPFFRQARTHYAIATGGPEGLEVTVLEQLVEGGIVSGDFKGHNYTFNEPLTISDVETATKMAYEYEVGEYVPGPGPARQETKPTARGVVAVKGAEYDSDGIIKLFRSFPYFRQMEKSAKAQRRHQDFIDALFPRLMRQTRIRYDGEADVHTMLEDLRPDALRAAAVLAYQDATDLSWTKVAQPTEPAAPRQGKNTGIWKKAGEPVSVFDIQRFARKYLPRWSKELGDRALLDYCAAIMNRWAGEGLLVPDQKTLMFEVNGPDPIYQDYLFDNFDDLQMPNNQRQIFRLDVEKLRAKNRAAKAPAAKAAPSKADPVWLDVGDEIDVYVFVEYARQNFPQWAAEIDRHSPAMLNRLLAQIIHTWALQGRVAENDDTLALEVRGEPLRKDFVDGWLRNAPIGSFSAAGIASLQQVFDEDAIGRAARAQARQRPAAPASARGPARTTPRAAATWKARGETFTRDDLIGLLERRYPTFCRLLHDEGYFPRTVADDLLQYWVDEDLVEPVNYMFIAKRGMPYHHIIASINTVIEHEFDRPTLEKMKAALGEQKAAKSKAVTKPAASKWKGITLRKPADSAGQFPKRCVGGPNNDARTMQYRFTIIAPLCQMPVACVVQTADTPPHNYCTSPDLSRSYSGGYFGGIQRITVDGKQWMRQHMQPGVIARDDFGKGVGPANYMSGPLHAVCDRGVDVFGTFSEVFGRTNAADAAWANLLKHHVSTQSITNMRRKRIPIVSSLRLSTQATKASGMRAIGNAVPDTVEVVGGDQVFDILEAKTILSLGIVLHVDPRWQAAVTHHRDPSTPYVCPADMWQYLDLSATDLDSLHKFLVYCSDHNGLDKPAGYLRAAQESLALNPSCPIVPADLPKFFSTKHFPALKGAATRTKKRNPAGPGPAARNLHAFLSDPSWGDRPTRENPRSAASEAWVAKFPRHHFDRPARPSTEVRAHFNLHTGGYSIDTKGPEGWRMRDDDIPALTLLNATFEYAPSKHRKYFESGKRDVHAWVYGTEDYTAPRLDDGVWRPCHYSKDPPCFLDRATKECLPTDGSVDVYLASASNVDPATGKPRKSIYSQGRALPWKPDAWWRPSKRPNPRRRRSK